MLIVSEREDTYFITKKGKSLGNAVKGTKWPENEVFHFPLHKFICISRHDWTKWAQTWTSDMNIRHEP